MDTAVDTSLKPRFRYVLKCAKAFIRPLRKLNKLFLVVVVIPTMLSVFYFGFLARDVYVSESQFVVRNMQRQASIGGVSGFLQGVGLSQSGDDVYGVQAFVVSRDALKGLEDNFQLKRSFSASNIDWIRRFNAMGWDGSFENLLRYYQNFIVSTSLDTTSSILTLTVRAFSPEDAYRINESLLGMSEDFVNRLNERARKDLLRFASADVDSAEREVKAAVGALSNFRNTKSLYDPTKQSDLQLQQVGALQQEQINTRNQITDLYTLAKDSPQIPLLERRLKTLDEQINSEMAKVAGGRTSLSSQSPEYETIMLDRDFATKRLDIALSALETARANAASQQLYVERIEEPILPDTAIEPRRVRNIAVTLLLSVILWGIFSLLVTAIKEHTD